MWVYPAHLAAFATFLRNQGHRVHWGLGTLSKNTNQIIQIIDDFQIDVSFENLPFPDRVFTDAKNPRWQSYGNYKFHPATHMMASNLCWYGKCIFCIDSYKLQHGEKRGVRSVDHVIQEIDDLIANGYKEVFDDSGTFPVGQWLEDFCKEMNKPVFKQGAFLKRKDFIKIGCNMKPLKLDYKMMSNAGFRFILVGIESANQQTLDKINKGQRSEDIIPIIKSMSDAGLEPHVTAMFGYEWETHDEAMRTVKLVRYLLKKGYAKTAQSSVYSLPRTPPDPNSRGHRYVPMIYEAYRSPQFWYHKLVDIRRWEDITYMVRGIRLVIEEKLRKKRGIKWPKLLL